MPDSNITAMPRFVGTALVRLHAAPVLAALRDVLEVSVEGESRFARLAIAPFYQPVPGDIVLVIESTDDTYVIGVLQAGGPMTLHAPADLQLMAPNGRIVLDAAALHLRAPEMQFDAGRLSVLATELRETFGSVLRIVREMLEIEAGAIQARTRALFSIAARRLRATAEEDVKIDGKSIHLG
jgi:hypothetical protein